MTEMRPLTAEDRIALLIGRQIILLERQADYITQIEREKAKEKEAD